MCVCSGEHRKGAGEEGTVFKREGHFRSTEELRGMANFIRTGKLRTRKLRTGKLMTGRLRTDKLRKCKLRTGNLRTAVS